MIFIYAKIVMKKWLLHSRLMKRKNKMKINLLIKIPSKRFVVNVKPFLLLRKKKMILLLFAKNVS